MPKLSQPLAGFCLALSLAASVFADEPPPSESTEATPAEPTETTAEPTSAAEKATPAAPAETASEAPLAANAAPAQSAQVEDDPIVCKRVEVTGTRLRKGKVCKPKSEWRAMSDDAQSVMKDVDRKSSPGPGGQTLPPGG